MILLPKATKTSLTKLVRSKGYNVPSIRSVEFSKCGRAFWIKWWDAKKERHTAYYSGAAGRPILQVDDTWHDIMMAEVIHFDLVEEK